jgi:hypothetical protein
MAEKPFFVVPHPLGTFAVVSNEVDGAFGSHLGQHAYRGLVWRTVDLTATQAWVVGDFGAARSVDFCALLGVNANSATRLRLNLGDTQAQVNAGGGSGLPYTSGAQLALSPGPFASLDSTFAWHWNLGETQTRRWWGINVTNHDQVFQAAKLVLGEKITVDTYYETEHDRGYDDTGSIAFTRLGVPEINAGIRMKTIRFRMGWLTESEIETKILPMIGRVGRSKPLLLCFDPEPTAYRSQRTYFGFLREVPRPRKRGFNRYEGEFDFISII